MRRIASALRDLAAKSGPEATLTGAQLRHLADQSSDLSDPISRYVAASALGSEHPLKVSFPAATFLNVDVQISGRLHLWFYGSLFSGLICAGLVLLLIALAAGIDELVFKSVILTQQPFSGFLKPLQIGVFAVSITLAAAFLVRIMTAFFIGVPRRQLAQLTSLLDSLFLANESSANTVAKPMRMLAEAQQQMAQDKSEQLGTVIDAALRRMSDTFTGEFASPVKTLGTVIGQVEKQVASSTAAVTHAPDTLARFANGQSDAIDQAIAASLKERVEHEKKAQDTLVKSARKAMETLTTDLTKAHQATVTTLETRLTALQESLQINAAALPAQLGQLDDVAAQDIQANLAALQATQQSNIKAIVEELLAAQNAPSPALEQRLSAHEDALRDALQTLGQALSQAPRGEAAAEADERAAQAQNALVETLETRLAALQDAFQAGLTSATVQVVERLEAMLSEMPRSDGLAAPESEAGAQLRAELANLSEAIERLASEGTALSLTGNASNPVADIIGDEYMRLLAEHGGEDGEEAEDALPMPTADAPEETVERVGRLTDALQQTNVDDKQKRQQERE